MAPGGPVKLFLSIVLTFIGIFWANPSPAWGLHYLLTDLSFSRVKFPELENSVRVEPLASLVAIEAAPLARLFADYYTWLAQTGTKRFHVIPFPADKPSVNAFLRAARLNPKIKFYSVRRLLPNQPVPERAVVRTLSELSYYERAEPGFRYDFVDSAKMISVRSVLYTYVDEPDWGMDRDLWNIADYGFGKMPFGKLTGDGSQAAFHMQFQHENFIVRHFVSELLEGMARERIELFSRLAKFAFASGHPYWGYRFSAWAMHYLQDLTQPYHAKAVPHADEWYYVKYVFSTDRPRIVRETTQLASNRHHLYEDFAKVISEDAFLKMGQAPGPQVAAALTAGPELPPFLPEIFDRVTTIASRRAAEIDKSVGLAFGLKLAADPNYELLTDETYRARDHISRIPPEVSDPLLKATLVNFTLTGAASRALLDYCRH